MMKKSFFLSHKTPLFKKGEIIGLFGMSTEITQLKQQQLQERLINKRIKLTLENIIANMPGHVYWKDINGVYLGCNDLQARSLNMKHGHELIGKTDFDLPWVEGVSKKYRENDLSVMEAGKTIVVEEISQMDGHEITVLSHKSPLRNEKNEIFGILGISLDITTLKELQASLVKSKEKAEIANKAKSEFLQNMRHDFRTPFTGILGMARLLYEEETDNDKKDKLNDIVKASQVLLEQLNEIADFIALEDGGLVVLEKQFDLYKVIDEVKQSLLPAAKEKQLKFKVIIDENTPRYIIGDRSRTHRILINLLANAIKFTKSGHVLLQVKLAKQEDNRCIIKFRFEDTGIGISKEDQDIIFEKFSRLTPSYKGIHPGKGLGLRIVKQFLDELDGEIHHIKSQLNKGTTFIILIPYKQTLLKCEEKELAVETNSVTIEHTLLEEV